jgi:hypothetical protein
MDRFNALGRGLQIMLVAGVLLFIATFLDWQSVDLPEPLGSVGVSAWDDIGGILLALLTLVLVAWIGARIAGVDIPLPVSSAVIGAGLAALILILAVAKNLQDDYSSIWAWVGMILAIVIAVGAWLEVQAAGGVNALKSEMPSMGGSTTTSASAPEPPAAAAPPPPPPAAEPEARPGETSERDTT